MLLNGFEVKFEGIRGGFARFLYPAGSGQFVQRQLERKNTDQPTYDRGSVSGRRKNAYMICPHLELG